jgi:hypothetical protein
VRVSAAALIGPPINRIRMLRSGRIRAVNGGQLPEQQGVRMVVDTFIGFLLTDDSIWPTSKYFRALRRAPRTIDMEPEKYKHNSPRETSEARTISYVRRFGLGERTALEPYTRETFDQTQRWMRSWNLLSLDPSSRSIDAERWSWPDGSYVPNDSIHDPEARAFIDRAEMVDTPQPEIQLIRVRAPGVIPSFALAAITYGGPASPPPLSAPRICSAPGHRCQSGPR